MFVQVFKIIIILKEMKIVIMIQTWQWQRYVLPNFFIVLIDDYLQPELIKKYAGQVEIHDVTTEDGYILTLYRIPRQNPKGVILIHHSIATYSHIYMWQGNNSLGMNQFKYTE